MFAIFPEILSQTQAGDLEAVTCLVRRYFADAQVFTPNLRVSEICANAEIKVKPLDRNCAVRMEAWDANGQFRIEISIHPEIKNLREQNYILALMLGHVFLDLQPKMAKGELQRSIFERKLSPLRELLLSPNSAAQADLFASSLLLPKAMVRKAMSALTSTKDVAAFFNVDLPLLDFRLAKLGLVYGATKDAPKPAKAPSPAAQSVDVRDAKPSSKPVPRVKDATGEMGPTLLANAEKDLSSLARVNRNTAARSYKKEGEALADPKPTTPTKVDAKGSSPGLKRLRQLAQKIDTSVSD